MAQQRARPVPILVRSLGKVRRVHEEFVKPIVKALRVEFENAFQLFESKVSGSKNAIDGSLLANSIDSINNAFDDFIRCREDGTSYFVPLLADDEDLRLIFYWQFVRNARVDQTSSTSFSPSHLFLLKHALELNESSYREYSDLDNLDFTGGCRMLYHLPAFLPNRFPQPVQEKLTAAAKLYAHIKFFLRIQKQFSKEQCSIGNAFRAAVFDQLSNFLKFYKRIFNDNVAAQLCREAEVFSQSADWTAENKGLEAWLRALQGRVTTVAKDVTIEWNRQLEAVVNLLRAPRNRIFHLTNWEITVDVFSSILEGFKDAVGRYPTQALPSGLNIDDVVGALQQETETSSSNELLVFWFRDLVTEYRGLPSQISELNDRKKRELEEQLLSVWNLLDVTDKNVGLSHNESRIVLDGVSVESWKSKWQKRGQYKIMISDHILVNAIKRGRLDMQVLNAQAEVAYAANRDFIFHGPYGSGKTSLLLKLALKYVREGPPSPYSPASYQNQVPDGARRKVLFLYGGGLSEDYGSRLPDALQSLCPPEQRHFLHVLRGEDRSFLREGGSGVYIASVHAIRELLPKDAAAVLADVAAVILDEAHLIFLDRSLDMIDPLLKYLAEHPTVRVFLAASRHAMPLDLPPLLQSDREIYSCSLQNNYRNCSSIQEYQSSLVKPSLRLPLSNHLDAGLVIHLHFTDAELERHILMSFLESVHQVPMDQVTQIEESIGAMVDGDVRVLLKCFEGCENQVVIVTLVAYSSGDPKFALEYIHNAVSRATTCLIVRTVSVKPSIPPDCILTCCDRRFCLCYDCFLRMPDTVSHNFDYTAAESDADIPLYITNWLGFPFRSWSIMGPWLERHDVTKSQWQLQKLLRVLQELPTLPSTPMLYCPSMFDVRDERNIWARLLESPCMTEAEKAQLQTILAKLCTICLSREDRSQLYRLPWASERVVQHENVCGCEKCTARRQ